MKTSAQPYAIPSIPGHWCADPPGRQPPWAASRSPAAHSSSAALQFRSFHPVRSCLRKLCWGLPELHIAPVTSRCTRHSTLSSPPRQQVAISSPFEPAIQTCHQVNQPQWTAQCHSSLAQALQVGLPLAGPHIAGGPAQQRLLRAVGRRRLLLAHLPAWRVAVHSGREGVAREHFAASRTE